MEGRVALVTGASRGIGQAILLELGRRGATVIGTATSDKGAAAITEAIKAAGLKGEGKMLNVTDPAQVDGLIEDILKGHGSLDVLVNNAGITRDNLLMRMKDEEWDEIIATNLTSVFRLSRAVLRPMMKARHGRIISIASVVGVMGNAGQTNYGAAKAGMIGFSKSLAREVGSRNITVNCVAPGFIDTDMTRALPEAQRQALLAHIPLGRLGGAEDIAQAVAFLASDQAGYVTGTTLHVNGGMYMD
ncbi:3-oxoacyl-[acyl-carrier-protein] reductase [Sulfuritortus calidifontis]|uniref:3-oxoacyl-[acyl-carrier-protein] reductase n=1 Tax=Sulfuritortus calidifontis TaxID=1914471 RepID=A0A4R3JTL8_9PROT|nr:3-oxoacyl-ACP reductase FabG [Sulfuritortus calidifontis]TCS70857.1 3-oxoacyl-[acyl-carrier-protein] reductase [Sulfuritortus calidifontis]